MECGRIWCLQGTGATAETMRCRPSQHVGSCVWQCRFYLHYQRWKVGWRLMTVHGSGCAVGCREHSQRRGTDRRALRHDKACQDPGVFFQRALTFSAWFSSLRISTVGLSDHFRSCQIASQRDIPGHFQIHLFERQRWTSVLPHSRWRWRTSPLQRLSPTSGCPWLSPVK